MMDRPDASIPATEPDRPEGGARSARKADRAHKAGSTAPKSARRRSRELAVQGLYQWLLTRDDPGVIEAHLVDAPEYQRADRDHFRELLHGIVRDVDALHQAIAPALDRPQAELSPVEHATILVGAYELARHPEIPYRVVINEAVECAKTFGGTDGFKYVNGVLDRVAIGLRPAEAPSRR